MAKKESQIEIRELKSELAFTVRGPHYSSVRFGYSAKASVPSTDDIEEARKRLDGIVLTMCLDRYEETVKELVKLVRYNEGRID